MQSVLDDYDMVVGAVFENGTIKDYIDNEQTYGLIRIENSTCKWFLYHKIESDESIQALYKKVTALESYFIHDEFGEELVLFDKEGDISYETFLERLNEYLNNEFPVLN
jgi:hypothetical protein